MKTKNISSFAGTVIKEAGLIYMVVYTRTQGTFSLVNLMTGISSPPKETEGVDVFEDNIIDTLIRLGFPLSVEATVVGRYAVPFDK